MKTIVIFHSHTGITRRVAERLSGLLGGEKIEIAPEKKYSGHFALIKGCYRSIKRSADPVIPGDIDVTDYDVIIIGSPVWAGRPSPVINGAIKGLNGCRGKKVFAVMTCRNKNSGSNAIGFLVEQLKSKGFVVSKTVVLDKKETNDDALIERIAGDIRAA